MSTVPAMAPELYRTIKPRVFLCPWGNTCSGRRCNAAHPGRPAASR